MTNTRYPYTYACDFIRQFVDDFSQELGMRIPTISRSQASQAMRAFEIALGFTHEEIAKALADAYLAEHRDATA